MEGTYLPRGARSAEKVVGVLRDPRPRLACRRSDGTREVPDPEAVLALDALSQRELLALEALAEVDLAWPRATFDRAVLPRLRARLAKHPERLDDEGRALLDEIGRRYGTTRPVHRLTPLCRALAGRGLRAMEIAYLLHALRLERIDDPEQARQRVEKRLSRTGHP